MKMSFVLRLMISKRKHQYIFLVIPKKPIISLLGCIEEDANLLGHLLFVGSKIAKSKNLTNFRTVINTGAESGQTVFHLHIHFLSGRKMNWPPG